MLIGWYWTYAQDQPISLLESESENDNKFYNLGHRILWKWNSGPRAMTSCLTSNHCSIVIARMGAKWRANIWLYSRAPPSRLYVISVTCLISMVLGSPEFYPSLFNINIQAYLDHPYPVYIFYFDHNFRSLCIKMCWKSSLWWRGEPWHLLIRLSAVYKINRLAKRR